MNVYMTDKELKFHTKLEKFTLPYVASLICYTLIWVGASSITGEPLDVMRYMGLSLCYIVLGVVMAPQIYISIILSRNIKNPNRK